MNRVYPTLARRGQTVDVVVIGAGHSGLAMSRCLSERAIEHVVLERGEVANAWRHERWDSFRLLTPNWQTRLPGNAYAGPDPNGFMTKAEIVDFIDRYAQIIAAPVRTETGVTSVIADGSRYRVQTTRGTWICRALVLASGAHAKADVPALARGLPSSVTSWTADRYRNPDQLDERAVLVVGASATGLQLADELRRSGRKVTLAVGEHVRMPRVYRGRDIQWWMHTLGLLDVRFDAIEDVDRARRVPSPQLVGSPERSTLDLNLLRERDVEIVGRLVGTGQGKAHFSGALHNACASADLKLGRLLEAIDRFLAAHPSVDPEPPPTRPAPTRIEANPRLSLDFARERIGTVIWATGFRPDYGWLHVPAFDAKGRLRHHGGIVDLPGLYALGLPFMRRRKSTFIHGAEDDVRDLSHHLHDYLRGRLDRPEEDRSSRSARTSTCPPGAANPAEVFGANTPTTRHPTT